MMDRQIHAVQLLAALALVLAADGSALARPLPLPVRVVGQNDVAAPAFLGDQFSVRLRPAAARQAVALRIGDGHRQPLGVAALDAAARSLGGAWFEPEFRGEVAPPAGSDATDFTAFHLVHLPAGVDLSAALDLFASLPEVESAEPIAVMPVTAVPNDSLWGISDWFYNPPTRRDLHAPEAWDVTTGDTSIVIAILDTGILPYHPDLSGSIWHNWAERGGTPGVDDDSNGFVDDTWGWDFVDLLPGSDVRAGEDGYRQENDPNDFAGHGTNVAGIVGAVANNGSGIAGTVWQTRLMTLRVGWASNRVPGGEISMTYAAQGVRYATRMGAKVINCSFSNYPTSELDLAVSDATRQGVLVVVAAGNNGSINGLGGRADVLTVGACDRGDRVPAFSNLAPWVDLVAPGMDLATTVIRRPGTDSLGLRQPGYVTGGAGTSFSTPFASGAAALVQARRLALGRSPMNAMDLLLHLRETADDISEWNFVRGYGTGRLNLARAVTEPPRSRVIPIRGKQIGPAAVVPREGGGDLIALATTQALLLLDADSGDTVREVPIPTPVSGVAAADMGGSFGTAMFFGLTNGSVAGFRPSGDPLAGWPVTGPLGGSVTFGPALGDLDGDGVLDIVEARPNGVQAWRVDGSFIMAWSPGGEPLGAPIALADLDGRPGVEIVAVSRRTVHVVRHDRTTLPGWPVVLGTGTPTASAPVVTLFRGELTVIVADPVNLSALRTNGSYRFRVPLWNWAMLDPALADVNGDGSDEVIVASGPFVAAFDSMGTKVWSVQEPVGGAWTSHPPVVGYLRGEPRPAAVIWSGVELTALAPDGVPTPGFPKPGGAGHAPTIVTRGVSTRILAGAGSDALFYVYDLGPGSSTTEPHPWPTGRGSYSRTGAHLPAGFSARIDSLPPLPVTDLLATEGPLGVEVTWSAPADVGAPHRVAAYELRWSTTPLDASNFTSGTLVSGVPTPGVAGHPEYVLVTGLSETSVYYFALRSRDVAWNTSPLSNVAVVTIPGRRPGPVRNLVGSWSRLTGVTLTWTATGDDSLLGMPVRYRIRGAYQPFEDPGFADAPIKREIPATRPAGTQERVVIPDLPTTGNLWFAVKADDDVGFSSAMSNVALVVAPDTLPPLAITDLAGAAGPPGVELTWSAPVEAGFPPQAAAYEIRWSPTPLDVSNFASGTLLYGPPIPGPAGHAESLLVAGLKEASDYYFALRSQDADGNVSGLSNVPRVSVPGYRPAPVVNLAGSWNRLTGVTLTWTATGDDSLLGMPARYRIRGSDRPFDDAGFDAAPIQRTGPPTRPAGGEERLVITGLPLRGYLWFALKAEDDAGLSTPKSNLVMLEAPLVPPSPVKGLAAAGAGDSSASLRWSATGDDGQLGRPVLYRVRAAMTPIDRITFETAPYAIEVPATVDVGGEERCLFAGLPGSRRLWFAVQAVGSTGRASIISNVATARTGVGGPLDGRAGTALAALRQPSRAPVQLYWQSDEARETAAHDIALFDLTGRCVRKLAVGSGVGGVVTWDGRDEGGARLGAGLYFARLSDGVGRADARIMLLP